MPPDSPEHDLSSEPMRDYLGAYRLAHPELVEWVVSECWVRVDSGTDRIGDIGIFLVGDRSSLARPERVPELIFEVVSPGRASRERDYVKNAESIIGSECTNTSSLIGCVVGSRCTLTQQAGIARPFFILAVATAVASFQASRFRSTISSNSLWL